MKSINAGAPHFRSIAKQHRHANYTLDKVINEAVDNIIKKATEIHITTVIDDIGKLQELKISDNYIDGFENIDCEGTACPLNMGYIRQGHDCDDETSEFGVGLKAGALNAGNKLEVITKVKQTGKCVKVVCDFQRMINESDVNNSYNPTMREASLEEYAEYHPFETGSSIIITQIRDSICKATTQQQLTQDILTSVSNTYSRLLSESHKIYVNGIIAEKEHDFFADPQCALFTVKREIVLLVKGGETKIMARKIVKTTTWQEFNTVENKWCALTGGADKFDSYLRDGYKYQYADADGSCIKVETTFTRFSEHPASLSSASDLVHIYKDRRKYGKKSFVKHNDGYDNYTIHKIDFKAKQIGKELGITYNKEITMDCNNNLINALKSAVADNRKEFINKPSSPKYCTLFEKAMHLGKIHWKTCDSDLLPDKYKDMRDQYELSLNVPSPTPAPAPVPAPDFESNSDNDTPVSESDSDTDSDVPSNHDPNPPVLNTDNDVPSNHDPNPPVSESDSDADNNSPVLNTDNDVPILKTNIELSISELDSDSDTDNNVPSNDDPNPPVSNADNEASISNTVIDPPVSNTDTEAPVLVPTPIVQLTTDEFVKQYAQYLMDELANGLFTTKSIEDVKMLMIEKLREPMVQDATAWHQEVEQPTVVLPLRSLL
jgi:hypothetical protein